MVAKLLLYSLFIHYTYHLHRCLLWFDNLAEPVLSNITDVYTVWPEYWDFGVKDGIFGPQVISCQIPSEYSNQIPQAISLLTIGKCDKINEMPSNVLRVIHNVPNSKQQAAKTNNQITKSSIGICVQAFRFGTYDVSVRLVEWLEMVRLLGADKVYFYVYGATQNMMKVLRHYSKEVHTFYYTPNNQIIGRTNHQQFYF